MNILLTVGILSTGEDTDEIDDIEMTYSIMSFPNDVQLCLSSIPGHKLGVCSKEYIPAGTWIGPYEGKRVPKGMLSRETADSGFCWEVRWFEFMIISTRKKSSTFRNVVENSIVQLVTTINNVGSTTLFNPVILQGS